MKTLQSRETFIFCIVSFLGMYLWLHNLGSVPYRDWDEGFYTVVSREMVETGDWVYPHYLNEPFWVKPPLLFWLTSLGYLIGGQTELAGRLPCALVSALGIPILYLVSRRVFDDRLIAILSALGFSVLLGSARISRLVMMDGPVTTFFLIMILGAVLGRSRHSWRLLIGLGFGAAVLCKGSLGILMLGIVLIYGLCVEGWKFFQCRYLWLGISLGLLPVVIWYQAQVRAYGIEYLKFNFQQQISQRVSSGIEGHSQPVWYYCTELLKTSMPMLLFAFMGFSSLWHQRTRIWVRFFVAPFILYFLAISLTETKLPWYVMPLMPFVAVYSAVALAEIWRGTRVLSGQGWLLLFSLLSAACWGGSIYLILVHEELPVIIAGISLSLGLSVIALNVRKGGGAKAVVVALLGSQYIALFCLFSSGVWLWELNENYSVIPVASMLRKHIVSHELIYTSYGYSRTSLDWYCHCRVVARPHDEIARMLESGRNNGVNYVLVDQLTWLKPLSKSLVVDNAEGFVLLRVSEPERLSLLDDRRV